MNENYENKSNQIFNLNDWNKRNGSLMNDKLIEKSQTRPSLTSSHPTEKKHCS